ncbi:MAG TPA: stage II sporulation protein M [Gemmatimonadaceae bacterium]|nr:stage II sporulation protein M [Gemmatimonadaceae bacterium]
MATTARSLEQTVDVETPELVLLSYSIAGVGSRVLAGLTDLVISLIAMLVLVVAMVMLQPRVAGPVGASTSWAAAVLILTQFALLWGYYVLFEGLMDGQTPGKRIHHLRVVREGGFSVTFGVSAVRNLVRIVDMQPVAFYLVGLGSILLTKRGQRLGDLVAGTIVVREALRAAPAVPQPVPPAESGAAPALQTALSEDEYRVLGRFLERSATLDPLRRAMLAGQLAERFATTMPEDDDRALMVRLVELQERERSARARGVSSRGETGAGRERQALIAANAPRWTHFASLLATAQKRGLRALGEDGVREFVAEYRAVAADLARLRTAAGSHAVDELFQVGRLVAGAHNLLYRDRGMALRATVRFLFSDVPREIRRSAAPIALAAALLFGPALVAGVAVARTPGLAGEMLPAGMLKRAEDGVRRAREGEGYIDDPQLFRPVMASSIVANNVQVSFAAFAGGITGGLLTAALIIANGISFGSVIGLYVSKGIGRLLLAFVAPHGVLELSAICIAAGAGFLVAAALIVPGARTRRRALVENSRRAVRLVGASTLMLLAAGLLEGLVSPIEWWPLEGKLAVSGTTLVLLVVYLRSGRPRSTPASTPEPITPALALGAVTARRAP